MLSCENPFSQPCTGRQATTTDAARALASILHYPPYELLSHHTRITVQHQWSYFLHHMCTCTSAPTTLRYLLQFFPYAMLAAARVKASSPVSSRLTTGWLGATILSCLQPEPCGGMLMIMRVCHRVCQARALCVHACVHSSQYAELPTSERPTLCCGACPAHS